MGRSISGYSEQARSLSLDRVAVRQDFKPPFDTTPGISRRTALCVAGTGVAYFATGYPAACAMGKPAPGGDGPRVERQSMHERHSIAIAIATWM
jgi:hypothetical protein